MRILTALALSLALLGASGCSSEEGRLRSEIEEKLAVHDEPFEPRQALRSELHPDWLPMNNGVGMMVRYNLGGGTAQRATNRRAASQPLRARRPDSAHPGQDRRTRGRARVQIRRRPVAATFSRAAPAAPLVVRRRPVSMRSIHGRVPQAIQDSLILWGATEPALRRHRTCTPAPQKLRSGVTEAALRRHRSCAPASQKLRSGVTEAALRRHRSCAEFHR